MNNPFLFSVYLFTSLFLCYVISHSPETQGDCITEVSRNNSKGEGLSDRAERVQSSVSVKGDAEKQRQAQREQIKANLEIGTKVLTPDAMGEGEIRKINNKSVQIYYPKFDKTYTTDISFVRIVG